MKTEERIAKITSMVNHLYVGTAEGMSYDVVSKPFTSNKELNDGNFVWCYVLQDNNDEFYLEENPEKPFATKEEWLEQEKQYA